MEAKSTTPAPGPTEVGNADSTTAAATAAGNNSNNASTTASSSSQQKPSAATGAGKKKKVKVDPAELARQQAEEAAAKKAMEAKQAIEDIPHQQMIKARRADVLARNAQLSSTLTSLNSSFSIRSLEGAEVLRYLETQVRNKDQATKQLTSEIKSLQKCQLDERAAKAQEYATEIKRLEETFAEKERELLAFHKSKHQEHADLLLFKQLQSTLQQELDATKAVLVKHERRHALQMNDLETKFLNARQRLLEESNARIAESRRKYKEEVGRELDLESQWIQQENVKMKHELQFHQALIEKLRKQNNQLQLIETTLKNNVDTLEMRGSDAAQKSLDQSKQTKRLKQEQQMFKDQLKQVQTQTQSQRRATKESIPTPIPQLPPGSEQRALKSPSSRRLITASSSPTSASSSSTALTAIPPAPSPVISASPSHHAQSLHLHALQSELSKLLTLTASRAQMNDALLLQLQNLHASQTEVEHVFYEVLHAVKREVVSRRAREYEEACEVHRDRLQEVTLRLAQPRHHLSHSSSSSSSVGASAAAAAAASIFAIESDPRFPPPRRPELRASHVRLDELTRADRERILQLLFDRLKTCSDEEVAWATSALDRSSSRDQYSRPSSGLLPPAESDAYSQALVPSQRQSGTRSRPLSDRHSNRSVDDAKRSSGSGRKADASSSAYVTQTDLSKAQAPSRSSPHSSHRSSGRHRRIDDEKTSSAPFVPWRANAHTPTELL